MLGTTTPSRGAPPVPDSRKERWRPRCCRRAPRSATSCGSRPRSRSTASRLSPCCLRRRRRRRAAASRCSARSAPSPASRPCSPGRRTGAARIASFVMARSAARVGPAAIADRGATARALPTAAHDRRPPASERLPPASKRLPPTANGARRRGGIARRANAEGAPAHASGARWPRRGVTSGRRLATVPPLQPVADRERPQGPRLVPAPARGRVHRRGVTPHRGESTPDGARTERRGRGAGRFASKRGRAIATS